MKIDWEIRCFKPQATVNCYLEEYCESMHNWLLSEVWNIKSPNLSIFSKEKIPRILNYQMVHFIALTGEKERTKILCKTCDFTVYVSVPLSFVDDNCTPLTISLWRQRCVAGVNNVRYWLRTYASMYASKLGLADYISGRTNQNQCRVASFPLYKKGDKVHFFYIYILFIL